MISRSFLPAAVCAILLNGTVLAKGVIPYSPAEKWQLVYEDGRREAVSIADGSVFHVPGGARLDGVATFSQEIFAPEDQTLQIGVGADWFWRCRLNGRIVADHFTDGNRYAAINKGNHLVLLPVKRGRNLLEIQVKSGSQGWSLAVGKLPLGYDVRKEQFKMVLRPSKRPQDNYLQSFLPRDFFERLENGAFDGNLYPPASDRTAWEAVKKLPDRQQLIREIVDRADAVLKEEIPRLYSPNTAVSSLTATAPVMKKNISGGATIWEYWCWRLPDERQGTLSGKRRSTTSTRSLRSGPGVCRRI